MNRQAIRKIKILKKERAKTLNKLCAYQDIMSGSLVLLRRRCGTKTKYPAYFLSKSERGKTIMRYIRKDEVKQIQHSIAQYKDLKRLIKRVCEINEKIIILEREV